MNCENCDIEHNGSYGSGRFCTIKCARGFATKSKREEINKKVSSSLQGRKLSDEHKDKISEANKNRTEEVRKKVSESLKKYYSDNPEAVENISNFMKNREVSDETKAKLSLVAISRGFGGVTQSRWIKYKGKTLGSSYELKVAEDLDRNGIIWDTCKKFPYIDNTGKSRTYTPDIYLIDYDVYLEPKNNFLIENINPNLGFKDTEKIQWAEEQNNIKVILLNKEQLSWEYIKSQLNMRT